MKKVIFTLVAILFFSGALLTQELNGSQADAVIPGSSKIWYNGTTKAPSLIVLNASAQNNSRSNSNVAGTVKSMLRLRASDDIREYKRETDYVQFTHIRYQQLYKNIPVEGGEYIAHLKGGALESMNGNIYEVVNANTVPTLTEKQALLKALKHIGAKKYKWENLEEVAFLKKTFDDPSFNYDPKGSLVLFPADGQYDPNSQFRLCYKFNIYAEEPESRANYFVDAVTGNVIGKHDLIHHAETQGSAQTKYSGTQTIMADQVSSTSYRLRETGRGNGIETWNAKTGQSTSGAVDFTDADNTWNNVNSQWDEAATDAHWASEMTYDYLKIKFNRNSIDNAGFKLLNYVHWGVNWYNASWNGSYMRYGDGNGGKPLTSADVGGHEMVHGLTSKTAKLVYQDEPGGLNESFSDIFGNTVERWARPSKYNWKVGEDFGAIRDMANPKTFQNPAYYKGQYWINAGGSDNGGVHTNSGVQNLWFVMLTDGKSGTNEGGNAYNVTGIGLDKAAAIAFRNLTVYLTQNSQFADARTYAIKSAVDLYGACSQEEISTTEAWYAVGVGAKFNSANCSNAPVAAFIADVTTTCTGTVQFTDQSTFTPTSWSWDFGDGGAAATQNPSHTYTANGTFTVKLTATNTNGSNTATKTSYITVNAPAAPAGQDDIRCGPGVVSLSATGSNTLQWYDAPTGGNLVNTGTTYSPNLSATTSFYVASENIPALQNVGEPNNSKAGGYFSNTDRRIIFDVLKPVTIKSVVLYANSIGNRIIEVVNSGGTAVATRTVNITATGMTRVTLNIALNPGNDYAMKLAAGTPTLDLYRNNAGGLGYPYTINGVVSIKTTDASTSPTNYYYFFYDWEVQEPGCVSSRTAVTGTISMCTGIASHVAGTGIKIYPVPVKETLNIEDPDNEISKVQVLNMIGDALYVSEKQAKGTVRTVDFSSFAPGVYFISVDTAEGKTVRKIVKE